MSCAVADKLNFEEVKQAQDDELLSLKAIFGDDLVDLRPDKTAWRPNELEVTLDPLHSLSQDRQAVTQVILYVRCGKRYPNVVPDEILLKNPKGVSVNKCQELRLQLYDIAKKMKGEVMIFELANFVRQFLHKHHQPPTKSFYDEMLSNRIKIEEQKAQEIEKKKEMEKLKREKQLKQLEEELQRKQNALREDSRMRKESFGSNSGQIEDDANEKFKLSVCKENHGTALLTFNFGGTKKRVQKCNCLVHDINGNFIDFLGVFVDTGELTIVSEWTLKLPQSSDDPKLKRSYLNFLADIENLVQSKLAYLNHPNLVKYFSFKYIIESDFIIIYLLRDFINGFSLNNLSLILDFENLNSKVVKNYCKDILNGLLFLHQNQLTHQSLLETNTYLDNSTGQIKLSGYYLTNQFIELAFHLKKSILISKEIANQNAKEDSLQLGKMIISLIKGHNYSSESTYNFSDLTGYNLDCDLYDFLSKCLESNEQKRWSVNQLVQHHFITSDSNGDVLFRKKEVNKINLGINFSRKEDADEKKDLFLMPAATNSRLGSEFEVINEIGKGGFGHVYKVRNKLDSCYYALKKIPVNPSNELLYKKILREVNFLSRLNHENVVRYFCSWIDSESNESVTDDDSSGQLSDTPQQISFRKSPEINEDNSEEEFETEPEDIFGTSFIIPMTHPPSISDDYIVFEKSKEIQSLEEVSSEKGQELEEGKHLKIPKHYMYIQMELCDSGTLRDAIDQGLYNNQQRKRRLFREIVEGLAYIHQLGMIHRDLKPGNIFLDYNDHVKIGDFGLATTELIIVREQNTVLDTKLDQLASSEPKYKFTGVVGTPLYMAPELVKTADVISNKISYTQKVDVYSLGVILFEMSYQFQTAMERTNVIMSLRKPEIVFPIDADQRLTQLEIDLLTNLLQHDSALRMSSSQLIDSEYLPPPEIEEKEEFNILKRVIINPRNKLYKYMLSSLFQKNGNKIEDFAYDAIDEQIENSLRLKKFNWSFVQKQRIFDYVYDSLRQIMEKHCATSVQIPTLIPKYSTKKYDNSTIFTVLDQNGAIITLPYDLRVPFARFIAKNKITDLRRYSISKVYRTSRLTGNHPKEMWECAFDIITPKHSSEHFLPDAETICVLSEIVDEFPMLQTGKLTLKINHMKLVKAILIYCDIREHHHQNVVKILCESALICAKSQTDGMSTNNVPTLFNRLHIKKNLTDSKILTEENRINTLISLMEMEQDNIKLLLSNIKSRMRKKGIEQQLALEMAKKSLKEIEAILHYAERMNQLKFQVKISPGLLPSLSVYNLYSGIVFMLDREVRLKKSNRLISNVIAVGGRYDELISYFDFAQKESVKKKRGVGVSIEFEKILKCVLEDECRNDSIFGQRIDVVICSFNREHTDYFAKELCSIIKEFWATNIRVLCFPEDLPKSIDDLHSFCIENFVRYAIVLKDLSSTNQITAKLIAYENERFIDKKGGHVCDIVEYVIRTLKNESSGNYNNLVASEPSSTFRSDNKVNQQSPYSGETLHNSMSSLASSLKISFITFEKLQPAIKRRHEATIINQLTSFLNFGVNNAKIEVLAVDLPLKVIKTISNEIEFDDPFIETKSVFEKSKISVMDKHPRFRNDIAHIMDVVFLLKVDKKCQIIILISISDDMKFKILH